MAAILSTIFYGWVEYSKIIKEDYLIIQCLASIRTKFMWSDKHEADHHEVVLEFVAGSGHNQGFLDVWGTGACWARWTTKGV